MSKAKTIRNRSDVNVVHDTIQQIQNLPKGDVINAIINDFPPMLVFLFWRCSLETREDGFKITSIVPET